MTSFAVRIEPTAQPRLAAAALLLHLAVASLPWIARCPPGMAMFLGLVALAGLPATLACVPGPHHRLRHVHAGRDGWRATLEPAGNERPAEPGPGSRVYPGFAALVLGIDGRRRIWLLPRSALPPAEFRRLKARIRLAC